MFDTLISEAITQLRTDFEALPPAEQDPLLLDTDSLLGWIKEQAESHGSPLEDSAARAVLCRLLGL
jgi:hypothetical protein